MTDLALMTPMLAERRAPRIAANVAKLAGTHPTTEVENYGASHA